MQAAARSYNEGKTAEDQILLCVGIGYGRILTIGDQDVFGAEVNAACKLGEDRADSWEILVTDSVRAVASEQCNREQESEASCEREEDRDSRDCGERSVCW